MEVSREDVPTMNTYRIPLRIVFYKEEGDWIAHCLEFDVIGDGKTKSAAIESLRTAMSMQIADSVRHNNPENLITPADTKYWQMYAAGTDVADVGLDIAFPKSAEFIIERTEAREYSDPDLVSA